jgi:DNA-binding MarR family transcriptional regulator
MAALWRRREGVTMTELSRMLLVSNGNATAVVDRLEKDGLARRTPLATDRRTVHVALTDAGLGQFEALALGHELQVNGLFARLDEGEVEQLTALLKKLRKDAE